MFQLLCAPWRRNQKLSGLVSISGHGLPSFPPILCSLSSFFPCALILLNNWSLCPVHLTSLFLTFRPEPKTHTAIFSILPIYRNGCHLWSLLTVSQEVCFAVCAQTPERPLLKAHGALPCLFTSWIMFLCRFLGGVVRLVLSSLKEHDFLRLTGVQGCLIWLVPTSKNICLSPVASLSSSSPLFAPGGRSSFNSYSTLHSEKTSVLVHQGPGWFLLSNVGLVKLVDYSIVKGGRCEFHL